MLALIFGISVAGIESDGIDVGYGDADGDRGEQQQSDHQDNLHVASLVCVTGSRIDACGVAQTYNVLRDAQSCMITVPSRCVNRYDAS